MNNKLRTENAAVIHLAEEMPEFANSIIPVVRDILEKFLESISDILKQFENSSICGTDAGRAFACPPNVVDVDLGRSRQ